MDIRNSSSCGKHNRCEIRILYTGTTDVVEQAEALETALGPLHADLKRTGRIRPDERFSIGSSDEGPTLTVITVNGDPDSIRTILEQFGFQIIPTVPVGTRPKFYGTFGPTKRG
ncbi:MAG: hypothetical protein G01um101472_449 [Parcubacteria group bacterium Gr01-1014_72]|nr:MAG: hypothetical protein G01um101472_449 [Parcubacteria group bacterium Gr01-1014_72]